MKKLLYHPWETGVALYSIINAFLTFSPDSPVLTNLWLLVGGYSIIAVGYQIFAGFLVLLGLFLRKLNIEVAGLIMLGSIFAIRAVALLTDKDITLSDLNSSALAIVFIAAAATRTYLLIKNKNKRPCLSQT